MLNRYTGRAVGGLLIMLVAGIFHIHKLLGYDKEGFDKEGFDKDGFDREGFDKNGYDRKGYDKDGFGLNGYNIKGYNRNGKDISGNDKAFYAEKIKSIKESEDLKAAFRTALFCLITHWQGENYCHNHIKKDLETCLQCNIISHELAEKIKSERNRENLDELISDIKYFC